MQTLFPHSHFGFEAAVRIGKRLVVGIAAATSSIFDMRSALSGRY